MEVFPVERLHDAVLSVAELPRAPGKRVEHRLDVRLRLTDHPQDLAGRSLPFEGFGQLALQVRIGHRRRSFLRGLLSRCSASRTKLSLLPDCPAGTGDTSCRSPPGGPIGGRSEPWAETNRPRLAWSRTRSYGSRLGRRPPQPLVSGAMPATSSARSPVRLPDAVVQVGRMSPGLHRDASRRQPSPRTSLWRRLLRRRCPSQTR